MQIHRLFEIVYLLLNQKASTAKELAEHFEVSVRTILRDIEKLSAAGIPIYTTQGKGGGIFLLDNYVLNKTTISDDEQNQILFALQSLAPTQHLNSSDILSKLRILFDKTDTHWIEVDLSRWGTTESDKGKFELLKGAIIKKQSITFIYPSSYGETTNRTVYPLKLVFKSTSWYLQAYCLLREAYRTFKVSRMQSLEILPDTFAEKHFSPPPIEKSEPSSSALIHLKMKFSPYAAYRVYDEFDHKDVVKNKDGSFAVTIDLPEDEWLYGFLLSLGSVVQVLEPQHVRTNLLERIENMRQFYLETIT